MDKVAVIWDALRDLVSFVPFTQREKQPWRSVTFSKVTGFSLQLCQKEHSYLGVFHVFKLYKWYQIAQSITCKIGETSSVSQEFRQVTLCGEDSEKKSRFISPQYKTHVCLI